MYLRNTAYLVNDYDKAISFFVGILGFELVEDSTSETNDGRPKRWVVVRPPGAQTGLLLAKADEKQESQLAAVGNQFGGRVGFFLEVEHFDTTYHHMLANGVTFAGQPRDEPYGRVAVFRDLYGNLWDLLGPASSSGTLSS